MGARVIDHRAHASVAQHLAQPRCQQRATCRCTLRSNGGNGPACILHPSAKPHSATASAAKAKPAQPRASGRVNHIAMPSPNAAGSHSGS